MDFIGAGLSLVGGLLGNKSRSDAQKKANRFNAAEAHKARLFSKSEATRAYIRDRREAQTARAWNRDQVLDARKYDAGVVTDARAYELAQTLAAEKRGRDYLAEDREYASPAAQRARLEAAGFNPLAGADASSAVMGGGAMLPAPVSAAMSGVASTSAVLSNVASSAQATAVQPEGADYSFIGDAFAAYGEAKRAEEEIALRRSEIEAENLRVNEAIQRAKAKPIVDGVFRAEAQGRSLAAATAPLFRDGVPQQDVAAPVSGQPQGGMPTPAGYVISADGKTATPSARGPNGEVLPPMDVYSSNALAWDDTNKRFVTIPNPDISDTGPAEAATGKGMLIGGAMLEDHLKTPVGDQGKSFRDVWGDVRKYGPTLLGMAFPSAFGGPGFGATVKPQRDLTGSGRQSRPRSPVPSTGYAPRSMRAY